MIHRLVNELFLIGEYLTLQEHQQLRYALKLSNSIPTINPTYFFESICQNIKDCDSLQYRIDFSKYMRLNSTYIQDYNSIALILGQLGQTSELERFDLNLLDLEIKQILIGLPLSDRFIVKLCKHMRPEIHGKEMHYEFRQWICNSYMNAIRYALDSWYIPDGLDFENACRQGSLPVVNILIDDDRVDPVGDNNLAFIKAAKYGHTDIVERLLQDARINPSDKDNEALKEAIAGGHVDIIKLLVNDPRVDRQLAISYAHQHNRLDILISSCE